VPWGLDQHLDERAEKAAACLRCRTSLEWRQSTVRCPSCGWEAERMGRVLSTSGSRPASFDARVEVLGSHNHHPVVWELCYRRQLRRIDELLKYRSVGVLLDIGCGPEAAYDKPTGSFVIGVEPSLPSLLANRAVDLGLHCGAERLPLADASVDAVVAAYALHHMIGATVAQSWSNVRASLEEIRRVTRPGGVLVVAEVCPWPVAWPLERLAWKSARRLFGDRVDFCFWPARRLTHLGAEVFPNARLELERFNVGALETFPPMIDRQDLRVPRILYPFSVCLFRWTLAG
jgi:SAM-dependent methyltransferase